MNPNTQVSAVGLGTQGSSLQSPIAKEIPKLGTKIILYWNNYSGLAGQLIEGTSLVQEGQKYIEVEVVAVKTAKVLFE